MGYSREFRAAMKAGGLACTPRWAYVSHSDTMGDGTYPPLELEWRAGVPLIVSNALYRGEREKYESCYLANVSVQLTATRSGDLCTELDPDLLVHLCTGPALVVVSDRRLRIKVDSGRLLDVGIQAGNFVYLELDLDAITSVQIGIVKKSFGRIRPGPTTITFADSTVGAMAILPERGMNRPWDKAARGVWARDVERTMFDDIARGLDTGVTSEQVRLAVPDTDPEAVRFALDHAAPLLLPSG